MPFNFFVEDESGNLTQDPMLVHTTATTASNGTFTVDISNAGLTHVHGVQASALAANNTLSNALQVAVSSFSTTSVGGVIYQPTTAVLGLLGITTAGAGHTVYITIIGDQN